MARKPKPSGKISDTSIGFTRLEELFRQAGDPLVALRIRHQSWIVPFGQLQSFSVSAAHKLVRRGLDGLLRPSIVAVGRFKIFVQQSDYAIELHLVVAGATRIKLERAFADARVGETKNVKHAIRNMLRGTLQIRSFGTWTTLRAYGEEIGPSCEQWPEYVRWLPKHFGMLLFRYGCDRYMNKLEKRPRKIETKVKKEHPYPDWLEPYQFGQPRWDNYDEPTTPRRLGRGKRAILNIRPDDINLEDDDE
jgi:hypothetical protein